MAWVNLIEENCTRCGLCAAVCGRGVLFDSGDGVKVNDEADCSLCGHCLAICPADAVRHEKIDQAGCIELDGGETLDPAGFSRFVKARRSHRRFRNKKVPRELLESCADLCRYCPTGSNSQSVELMVISDPGFIHELSSLSVDHFRNVVKATKERRAQFSDQGRDLPPDLALAVQRAPKLNKLIERWENGYDPILRSAPVVMVFHSTLYVSTPKDDCVIAAQTVTLYARTLGLESCYIGLLEKAFWGHEPVRDLINLPGENGIYSVLIMGWPRHRFLRSVERKPIKVTWRQEPGE